MPTSSGYISSNIGLFAYSREVVAGKPNWSLTSNGGTSTTVSIDTSAVATHNANTANAGDDYFNHAQVYFLKTTTTADLQGKVYDVTDYVAPSGGGTTGTFHFSALDASPTAGDVFFVFWVVPASNISHSFSVENIERDLVRQTLDKPSSLKGLKVANGSFDCEIGGLVNTSAAGTTPGRDRLSHLLYSVGTRRASAGELTLAGCSTTVLKVTTATIFAVDDLVMVEMATNSTKEIRRVSAIETSPAHQITLSQPLSQTPGVGDLIATGEIWTPADYDHQTYTLLHLTDDRLVEFRRAVLSLKAAAAVSEKLNFSFEFDAASMDSTNAQNGWLLQAFAYGDGTPKMDGSQITKKPPVYTTGAVNHFGSTELHVASFEFDLGHARSEHRYINNHHFTITERASSLQIQFKDASVIPKNTWEASGTTADLLLAVGRERGNTVAFYINGQIQEGATNENNNEFNDWSATFAHVDDQTDANQAKRPKIVRF